MSKNVIFLMIFTDFPVLMKFMLVLTSRKLHINFLIRQKLYVNLYPYTVLCKGFETSVILLYFARKMGERLNNLLKNKQTYIEI